MKNEQRTPLYIQIQEYLKHMIATNQLSAGEKLPTEKKLMDQFQVSRITVGNALAALTKEGLIQRIPGRGSYVLKKAGASGVEVEALPEFQNISEQSNSGNRIGLIIPSVESYFLASMVEGIRERLAKSRYTLITIYSNGTKDGEDKAIRELITFGAVGLLVFPVDGVTYNEEILSLKVRGFPIVLLDRYWPGVETNYVSTDNELAMRMVVSHLWELGHRDIAVCTDTPLPTVTVTDRINGYMAELTSRGAMINPSLILTGLEVTNPNHFDDSLPLLQYMKSSSATAYIALRDTIAILLYRIARRIGRRVPEDISIVSFDAPLQGYEEFDFFTQVDQSERLMGRTAAEIMLRTLEPTEPHSAKYEQILLKSKLRIRNSSGVVRSINVTQTT